MMGFGVWSLAIIGIMIWAYLEMHSNDLGKAKTRTGVANTGEIEIEGNITIKNSSGKD